MCQRCGIVSGFSFLIVRDAFGIKRTRGTDFCRCRLHEAANACFLHWSTQHLWMQNMHCGSLESQDTWPKPGHSMEQYPQHEVICQNECSPHPSAGELLRVRPAGTKRELELCESYVGALIVRKGLYGIRRYKYVQEAPCIVFVSIQAPRACFPIHSAKP